MRATNKLTLFHSIHFAPSSLCADRRGSGSHRSGDGERGEQDLELEGSGGARECAGQEPDEIECFEGLEAGEDGGKREEQEGGARGDS